MTAVLQAFMLKRNEEPFISVITVIWSYNLPVKVQLSRGSAFVKYSYAWVRFIKYCSCIAFLVCEKLHILK